MEFLYFAQKRGTEAILISVFQSLSNEVASPFGAKYCYVITLQKGKTSSSFNSINRIWAAID